MQISLDTTRKPDGIHCAISAKGSRFDGMSFGKITPKVSTEVGDCIMWQASPDAQLPKAIFLSQQAAEYYMLAAACEYVKVAE